MKRKKNLKCKNYLVQNTLLFFFILQYCVGFAIHQHESTTGVHVFPILNLPPYPIPLGCPQAPALSALIHASNLHWSSILPVVMYMFQFYSLKSPHPRLLPLSPKVCSLHLCLLCCPACRIIGTIFLNSIYMSQYTVFVFLFLTYLTLYNRLQVHPPHQN